MITKGPTALQNWRDRAILWTFLLNSTEELAPLSTRRSRKLSLLKLIRHLGWLETNFLWWWDRLGLWWIQGILVRFLMNWMTKLWVGGSFFRHMLRKDNIKGLTMNCLMQFMVLQRNIGEIGINWSWTSRHLVMFWQGRKYKFLKKIFLRVLQWPAKLWLMGYFMKNELMNDINQFHEEKIIVNFFFPILLFSTFEDQIRIPFHSFWHFQFILKNSSVFPV